MLMIYRSLKTNFKTSLRHRHDRLPIMLKKSGKYLSTIIIKIPTLALKAAVVYTQRKTKKKRRKLQNISSLA